MKNETDIQLFNGYIFLLSFILSIIYCMRMYVSILINYNMRTHVMKFSSSCYILLLSFIVFYCGKYYPSCNLSSDIIWSSLIKVYYGKYVFNAVVYDYVIFCVLMVSNIWKNANQLIQLF